MSDNLKSPDCPFLPDLTRCRITFEVVAQEPIIDWTPEYDGAGRQTDTDPNTYVKTSKCKTCNQMWQMTWTGAGPASYMRMA